MAGATRGIPIFGRDASQNVDYLSGATHGSDLEANAPTRHNPLPGAVGNVPVSDGSKWVATPAGGIGGGLPPGTLTGDIVRFNAGTGAWEVAHEPFHFQGIVLTPAAASLVNEVGAMYFDSVALAVFVCTEV